MLPVSPELIDELTPSHCEAVVIGLCLAVVVGVVGGRVLIEALRGPAKLAAGRLTCALIGHRSALDEDSAAERRKVRAAQHREARRRVRWDRSRWGRRVVYPSTVAA